MLPAIEACRVMNFAGILIIAFGLFTFGGGFYQWPFFMNNSRARFVISVLSRTGARVFYMVLGAAIVVFGLFATFADMSAP